MRTAFVTGGAAGIGAAVARAAARDGYRVGLFDRDGDKARALATEIGDAIALPGDVSSEESVEAALDLFGSAPDLLINNAGVVVFTPLLDMPVADFRRVMDVNVNGAFIAARAAARRMKPRGSGVIINITSIGGITPSPGTNAYAPAKGGLAKLTELMALEWGPLGIRVNAVAPGFIDGGMSEAVYRDPQARERRSKGVPLGRLGSLEDIAEAVMFLASDKGAYINGHQLVVDGGVTSSVLLQLSRG